MNRQRWIARINKWGNFGLGPIPTRQYSAALFALCGHILFGLLLSFALIPPKPERVQPPASKTIQVRLNPAAKVSLAESTTKSIEPPAPSPATSHGDNQDSTAPAIGTAASAPTPESSLPANQATAVNPPTTSAISTAPAATENPAQAEVAYYYPPRQLHQKPQVIEDIESNMSLTLPGIETQNVILRLFINELGAIDHVDVEQSSLTTDAVAAVSGAFGKLRFTPGKIDGVAVKSQLKIEVLLENAEASKTGKGN